MAEFWTGYVWPTIWIVIQILIVLVPLLIAVAYLTYAERKVIAAMQLRQGPMVVGPMGLWQPFADGLKMFVKETVIPTGANKVVFIMAPMVTFVLATIGWAVIPFGPGLVISDINVGILYLFAISSLGVYGIIMAGWASNSRYAFLGALRSAAQMVSYEISIGLIIINVLITVGSLNLSEIVLAQQTCGTSSRTSRCSRSSSCRSWPRPTAIRSTSRRRRPSWWPATTSNTRRWRSPCSSSANTRT